MKYVMIALILACGLKPLEPLGCWGGEAVCVCNSNGDCDWVWICK